MFKSLLEGPIGGVLLFVLGVAALNWGLFAFTEQSLNLVAMLPGVLSTAVYGVVTVVGALSLIAGVGRFVN